MALFRDIFLLATLILLPGCGEGLSPWPLGDDGGIPLKVCEGLPAAPWKIWRNKDGKADVTLVLSSPAKLSTVNIDPHGELDAAAAEAWVDGVGDLSGFLISRKAFPGGVTQQVNKVAAELQALTKTFTSVTIRHPGRLATNADGDAVLHSTVIELSMKDSTELHWVRNSLYPLIGGGDLGKYPNLPQESQAEARDFVLEVATALRPTAGQVIFSGGVVTRRDYDLRTSRARVRVADLANGTAVARRTRTPRGHCATFKLGPDPVMDLLWLIDESQAAQATRIKLHGGIASMWTEARKLRLDFRMAVAGMGRRKKGGATTADGLCSGGSTPGEFYSPYAGGDLPPEIQPCLLGPSGTRAPAQGNHGLTNMREVLASLVPAKSGSSMRLRPGATPVVFLVSEDPGKLILDALGGKNVLPPFNKDQVKAIENVVKPFADLLKGRTKEKLTGGVAHALTPAPKSGCAREARGTGYIELAQAVGGRAELTCHGSNGMEHVLVELSRDLARRARALRLTGRPISSSVAVSFGRSADAGLTGLSRSRADGFDYHAASGSLLIYRDLKGTTPEMKVSYLAW